MPYNHIHSSNACEPVEVLLFSHAGDPSILPCQSHAPKSHARNAAVDTRCGDSDAAVPPDSHAHTGEGTWDEDSAIGKRRKGVEQNAHNNQVLGRRGRSSACCRRTGNTGTVSTFYCLRQQRGMGCGINRTGAGPTGPEWHTRTLPPFTTSHKPFGECGGTGGGGTDLERGESRAWNLHRGERVAKRSRGMLTESDGTGREAAAATAAALPTDRLRRWAGRAKCRASDTIGSIA